MLRVTDFGHEFNPDDIAWLKRLFTSQHNPYILYATELHFFGFGHSGIRQTYFDFAPLFELSKELKICPDFTVESDDYRMELSDIEKNVAKFRREQFLASLDVEHGLGGYGGPDSGSLQRNTPLNPTILFNLRTYECKFLENLQRLEE
jgi:hypothetical protein